MKNYDPNMTNGVHVIETVIQSWKYKGRIIRAIGGNCFGKAVLDFDFDCEDDDVKSDCGLKYDEDYDRVVAKLHDESGNQLSVKEDPEDFNDMIVKNEIIGQFETWKEADAFIKTLKVK